MNEPQILKWQLLLRQGAERLRQGKYEEATHWFESAYGLAPEEPLVCYALGRERMRQGQYREAERLVRLAWEADQTILSAGLTLVRLLGLHLRRKPEALALLDFLSKKNQGEPEVLDLLKAEILLTDPKDAEDATRLFEEVLASGKHRDAATEGLARAYNVQGIRLAEAGKVHEALFVLKKAAALVPDWAPPLVNMGVVFQLLGKDKRAKKEYLSALDVEPDSATALYNLGRLAAAQEDFDEAAVYYRRLLDAHPSYPGVRSALADLARRRASAQSHDKGQ